MQTKLVDQQLQPVPRHEADPVAVCLCTVQSSLTIGFWLDYHRAIGVTHVHIRLDQTTTDNTLKVLAPYKEIGLVRSIRLASMQKHRKTAVLQDCVENVVATMPVGTWLAAIDDDEFLVPMAPGSLSVHDVLRQVPLGSRRTSGRLNTKGMHDCLWVARHSFAAIPHPAASLSDPIIVRHRQMAPKAQQFPKAVYRPHAYLRHSWPPSLGEVRHGPTRGCTACSHLFWNTTSLLDSSLLRINHYSPVNLTEWARTRSTEHPEYEYRNQMQQARLESSERSKRMLGEPTQLDEAILKVLPKIQTTPSTHVTLHISVVSLDGV